MAGTDENAPTLASLRAGRTKSPRAKSLPKIASEPVTSDPALPQLGLLFNEPQEEPRQPRTRKPSSILPLERRIWTVRAPRL